MSPGSITHRKAMLSLFLKLHRVSTSYADHTGVLFLIFGTRGGSITILMVAAFDVRARRGWLFPLLL